MSTSRSGTNFADEGFEILNINGIVTEDPRKQNLIAKIPPKTIYEFACAHLDLRADTLFLSCTGLTMFDIIADLERDLGGAGRDQQPGRRLDDRPLLRPPRPRRRPPRQTLYPLIRCLGRMDGWIGPAEWPTSYPNSYPSHILLDRQAIERPADPPPRGAAGRF